MFFWDFLFRLKSAGNCPTRQQSLPTAACSRPLSRRGAIHLWGYWQQRLLFRPSSRLHAATTQGRGTLALLPTCSYIHVVSHCRTHLFFHTPVHTSPVYSVLSALLFLFLAVCLFLCKYIEGNEKKTWPITLILILVILSFPAHR